jgi:ketosteroid isomerase-like protein
MKLENSQLIIDAERTLANAHISMDINAIDSLLHAKYIILQPGGKIESKADVIDSYKTGHRHWEQAKVDDLNVKIFGQVARVTGLWQATGTNNDVPFDYEARFISIWIKEKNGWQNISYTSYEVETQLF